MHSKAGDQGDLQMRQQLGAAKSVAKKKEDVLYKLDKLTDKRNVLRGNAGEVRLSKGFSRGQQSVATPQAARGWAHSPCRHFNIQSCCCLGSAFEVKAFQTMRF